jgi:murein DD-endopeptidase MepM/ murein hydrolase activator NlpD
VIAAGWDFTGYGNRTMIDHGNGFVTLYGHQSLIQVQVGQKVARGNVIGQMGNTGRSTGVHLHFEVRHGGVLENPGNYLK